MSSGSDREPLTHSEPDPPLTAGGWVEGGGGSGPARLDFLGLRGGYQYHAFPIVQPLDERVHQIFYGFARTFDLLIRQLLRRLPGEMPCWADGNLTTLGQCQPCSELIVPASRMDHPGGVEGLVWVVDRLLGPEGCPWDKEQTHQTLKKYLLEESYELFQAIDEGNFEGMKEELGDVLLQPLMHAQIRRRDGEWGIEDVASQITDKLIRRHPHVFGDVLVESTDDVLRKWDQIKKSEKSGPQSILSGIPLSMPSLLRAMEVSKRAARSGFEWPDFEGVWAKFDEETAELREALAVKDADAVSSELGDLLFTVVNLARWARIDPEDALRVMLDRFTLRFQHMESSSEVPLAELSPREWDDAWNKAKLGTS